MTVDSNAQQRKHVSNSVLQIRRTSLANYYSKMNETNLNPQHAKRNTKSFPSFSKPKVVGCFSLGPERDYIPSAKNLKYLNLPKPKPDKPLNIDLNEGFEIRQQKPDSAKEERLDHLLRFIIENVTQLRNPNTKDIATRRKALNCDFVCFRGLLRMIMCTPYEKKTSWIILASRYKQTIYLCAKDTPEKIWDEENQTEQQKRFCYYGFKFEQHILTGMFNVCICEQVLTPLIFRRAS